jgi:hypothetical protein
MRLFWKDFKKMDPDLGAMDRGAELTRQGAMDHGAEIAQFLATVCERDVRRGQGVGALICGADLGGALICGAEEPLHNLPPYSQPNLARFLSTSSSSPTSPHFDS